MQNAHNENPCIQKLSGAILAGGKSRRMGRDKALLTVDGIPLIEHTRSLLRHYCTEVFIAGERPDLATDEFPAYADQFPGSSLGGVHTALKHAVNDWVLVAACDLVRPSALLLRALLSARTKDCAAVVPVTPKGPEPLFALYHRCCLQQVEAMLTGGELTVQRLFERIEYVGVNVERLVDDWRALLGNVNTPADLVHYTQESK